jgi:hypothetical protein
MSEPYLWISYDLGVRGDYDGLYAWLDDHEARECGDSLALVRVTGERDLHEWLRQELEEAVNLTRRSRVYAVAYYPDEKRLHSRFVVGRRKSPPWSGFGSQGLEDEEGDEDG